MKKENKKQQQVSTLLGTIIIVIFSITVGVFVWKVEKGQPDMQQPQNVVLGPKQNKDKQDEVTKEKPIDTSDWKVCRSEKYNYEFKYPSDWDFQVPGNRVVKDCSNEDSIFVSPMGGGLGGIQHVVFGLTNDADVSNESNPIASLDDFLDKNPQILEDNFEIEKEILIQDEKALITKVKNKSILSDNGLIVFHKGYIYSFDANDVTKREFEVIIETFKFIK
jgi:hypothetical protein